MNRWVSHETIKRSNFSPPPPPPPPLYENSNFQNKISPSILLIIVILAVIFFISGLLHLLVRYLLRPPSRGPDELDDATALQGQLQQLFHLHDAGVDQSSIDALPVFLYRAVIGLKDPFDCAVCLCEFDADDRLRLLPQCSHAFHVDCIDTWLLSHSTCPLCRSSLLPPDCSPNAACSPLLLVLESGGESFSDVASDRPEILAGDDELGPPPPPPRVGAGEDARVAGSEVEKIVPVKLGKFRSVEICGGEEQGSSDGNTGAGGGGDNTNLDQRRCFSMGSYEYVMDQASSLKVPIKPPKKKPTAAAAAAAAKRPGHRLAMSECDCNSQREGFKGFDAEAARPGTAIQKRECFSVSKTWLRPNKECDEFSRRAASFRLPFHRSAAAAVANEESMRKTGGELELNLEAGSCSSSSSSSSKRLCSRADEAPSFARRTLNWIVGRQNRVGNHL